MSDRVKTLIQAFGRCHQKPSHEYLNERFGETIAIEDLIAMIIDETYISSPYTETDYFEKRSIDELVVASHKLFELYNHSQSPYTKIISALLLYRIFGYYIPNQKPLINLGHLPYSAISMIEEQRFEDAVRFFEDSILQPDKASEPVLKGIGTAFYERAFQLLEVQVQDCIKNRKPDLFESFDPQKHLKRIPVENTWKREVVKVPVRIELTSCVGSDIFLLAMLNPEKARCINISVDLYNEKTGQFQSPIQVIVRPTKERGIRLTSQDLGISKLVTSLEDLFNMRNDDLSLLKAAVIASGVIPPSTKECSQIGLVDILDLLFENTTGYHGFELITVVVQIPRGSGLAVSTNLLSGMIYALMRFSGQYLGAITDEQKVDIATRAIYGEWLGGSGGGCQDYGGMWGGFKEILGTEADPVLEPRSKGGFLPIYKKMNMPQESISNVLDSMILLNGGTGQNVGPILRMITAQFITKNDTASWARTQTERNYDLIRNALWAGDSRKLASLESADFINRVNISPLANNKYHQLVYDKLQSSLGDDLWGYDSTGGRAGAGGVIWGNPQKKSFIQETYLNISNEVQKELSGQMHFASTPLVYDYRLNDHGLTVETINDEQIEKYLEPQRQLSKIVDTVTSVEEIKLAYGFEEELFKNIQQGYQEGKLSLIKNIDNKLKEREIVLSKDILREIPLPDSPAYQALFNSGLSRLKEEPLAYITLNGGESTRYGTNVIRGLNPSIYVGNQYCSPIELKMLHFKHLRDRFGIQVLPVFVNGYFTEKNTKRVLSINTNFGLAQEDTYHCSHQVIHRVVPTLKDLHFWFEQIREKSRGKKEEELAHQYHHSMMEWAKQKGEGSIYEAIGKNKLNTLVSPGHYFSFMSIVSQGILGKLIKRGVKHLVVSSNDNLMSTIDPAIFAYHVSRNNGVTSEVVPKLFDRGGAPIMVDGKIEIYEDFRFPDMETLSRVPYFNPITTWIKIDSVLTLLGIDPEQMVQASEGNVESMQSCISAVRRLADKLHTYPVLKHINEDMGSGITYTFPVIQFEKLFGDLITTLSPEFLLVPKLMRHTQIKSVDHIYQLYNDRSLDILQTQIAVDNLSVSKPEPSIELTS